MATHEPAVIDVRKLAALDIVLHGARLIVAEFAVGVLLCGALGAGITYAGVFAGRDRSPFAIGIGVYLLGVGLNYLPLLLYALVIARRGSAREEVARELSERDRYVRRYSLQQFLLLVPLVVPALAIGQELARRGRR
jgi:hypothetical protein